MLSTISLIWVTYKCWIIIERIDTNKIDDFRDGIICHYWFFLRINFRFQPSACDGCHNMTPKSINFDKARIRIE